MDSSRKANAGAAGPPEQQRGQGGATGGAGAGEAASSGAGVPGPDQERPMEVSREGSPAGMQPGESGGVQAGAQTRGAQPGTAQSSPARQGAVAPRQAPGLLPAFMANPGLMASAFMANPFQFAELMTREMDQIFETFGMSGGAGGAGMLTPQGGAPRRLAAQPGNAQRGSALSAQPARATGGRLATFTPHLEVLQRGNELVVRADLPGLRPDDVTVEVEDGVLAISGERREEVEDQREGFYHTERRYGSFHRVVPLPEGVSEDQINASFRDGVLEVTLPLPQPQEPQQRARRIPIQSAGHGARGQSAAGAGGAGGGSATTGDATTSAG